MCDEDDSKSKVEIANHVRRAYPELAGQVWLKPMNYRLDGCFYKQYAWYQAPRLFFEAKQSRKPYKFYRAGYNISVGKLMASRWLHDVTGLRSALFVRFSDGIIAGTDITNHDGRFIIGGSHRGRPYDLEPEAQIPWDRFRIIEAPPIEVP